MKQIITQKNFVEKLKRRNEKALEYVIREYGGYVKAAVNHNLAGLPEEMEECMDDVFLDVWEHIERFDAAKGSFKNWIVSIARFRSIDYLRRYSRTCMEEDVSNYESELAKNQFAHLLKYYLRFNEMSQVDLVNALGYDKSTVSGWCSGTRVPKLDTIIDIANYLHVDPGNLITESREAQPLLSKRDIQIAEQIANSKDLFLLFDAACDASPEDIQTALTMLQALKKKGN